MDENCLCTIVSAIIILTNTSSTNNTAIKPKIRGGNRRKKWKEFGILKNLLSVTDLSESQQSILKRINMKLPFQSVEARINALKDIVAIQKAIGISAMLIAEAYNSL